MNKYLPLLFLILSHNLIAEDNPIIANPPVIASPPIVEDKGEYPPLEKALVIVYRNSKDIEGKQKLYAIAQNLKSSDWDLKGTVRTGYAQKTTQEFAPGIDSRAAITFNWSPDFGYTTADDKTKAQARTSYLLSLDSTRNAFIADMQTLSMIDVKLTIQNRLYAIAVQKLKRIKQYNDKVRKDGREDSLKPIDDIALGILNQQTVVKLAEHELNSQVRTISVKWGFEDWNELEILITNYIKRMRNIDLTKYNK